MSHCDECFDCRKENAKPKLLSLVEVAETLRKYHAITGAYAYSIPITELLKMKPVFKTETLEGYRPSCIFVGEPNEIKYRVCMTKGCVALVKDGDSHMCRVGGFTGTRGEPWAKVHDAVCMNCGLTFESNSDLVSHACEEEYNHNFLGQRVGRPSWDEYFLDIAKVVATRADCTRRKVGAVIVKNNRIISTGYNGAPAGKPGCLTDGACPRGKLTYEEQPKDVGYANCGSVHAEANAIIYAHQDLRDATLYCTDKPCVECEKLITGAGIKTVITP